MSTSSTDERVRALHALERLEATVASLRRAIGDVDHPVGDVMPLVQTAYEVAMALSRADAYWRAEHD